MMNVTLETYETQCDSYPFVFPKMATVEVADRLAPLLYQQLKSKGVFIIPDNDSEFEEAKRQAMINYLNGRLKTRIENHLMQKDEYERKGATFQYTDSFNEAIRWDKEIREILNRHKPIRESGSFFDYFERDANAIQEEVKVEASPVTKSQKDFDNLASMKYPPRRGRPAKNAIELGEIDG